ncbi:MAG TPA: carbohydrate kinase family protein [Geminicoccus sp.]|jgi:ribokinase|uniref:carbohydrate kinase family protein n=1 Tax=Geminicoccus sp. TaxID=2024832 RepID=UPI002E34A3EE|nr:carbohydrate kinase family protein [Geminicoccus sp.]HEX2528539.1 carbohydrate kinase family protein [Geminicoccus sp.]
MSEIVTIGWLTIDDIILGDVVQRDVLGGGALYSAVGAQVWNDSVGIHSVTGRRHLGLVRADIEARGLDSRGIETIEGNGLQLWLLHENDSDKQQIPKLSSSTAAEMDAGRGPLPSFYRNARGFHIAPQGPDSSVANAVRLDALPSRPVVTLDLLSDGYIDASRYRDLTFLRHLSAFLPSEAEIRRIWQPADLEDWLTEQAVAHHCPIAVKLGEQGSIVCLPDERRLVRVPAYPAAVVDTTGAGDAFCGGFLAGLVDGKPLDVCAAMGTVAASYVIEACGALRTARPGQAERQARLERVRAGITATDF